MNFKNQTFIQLAWLIVFFTFFCSCNGQEQKTSENAIMSVFKTNIGETVPKLGKDIGCVLQDKNGNYWFASNGEGVYCYNGKALTHITQKDGLCSNFVLKIEQDIHGNLWFSTRDGICNYNGIAFTNYINTIKKAPKGKLKYTEGGLFFGHSDGICFYDGKSFTNFVIHPKTYQASLNNVISPYGIYSTLVDKKGNIWFGTESRGVCFYDGEEFRYITEKKLDKAAVRTIFQDKKGDFWFGNNGGGLYHYDGKILTNITEEKGLGNPEFLKGNFKNKLGSLARVWAINEDNDGNLLIGTIDAGVWKFDGVNLTNYTTKEGLKGNSIWVIYKNNKNELLFVTNGESICKFNGKTFVEYTFH